MSIAARLQKVSHGLSARQRAILVLRSQREGKEVDPDIRRIEDEEQRRAFNRYMALCYVINTELAARCHIIAALTEALDRYRYLFGLLREAAGLVEEAQGMEKPAKASRAWRSRPEVSIPEVLRGVAEEVRHEALNRLGLHWKELRALESVWAELATEFEGEDPLHPDLRTKATDTAATLRSLAAELGGRRRLVEPDEAMLDEVRSLVEGAFKQLGLVGVYS